MNTKYTIIIFLLLLFFVNVVVADLPTKTVFNPYGGHLQLIPNTTGIFSNTSALILALQGNDSVINNSIIALQGNDSVINNSIIALQNNDTVINASILQLQNNDTLDRSYVNNTFLPLAGGNMTGQIVNTSINGRILFNSELDKTKVLGDFNTLDLNGVSYYFFTTNRLWNTTTLVSENGSYPQRKGGNLLITNAAFRYQTYEANSTTATTRWSFDDSINTFILWSGTSFKVTDLSGSGNAYACVDSTGKLYRSATACA